jgi:hypothetical protein
MAMLATAPTTPMKVNIRTVRDSQPLRASPIVRRSAAMRSMIQISGTAATDVAALSASGSVPVCVRAFLLGR